MDLLKIIFPNGFPYIRTVSDCKRTYQMYNLHDCCTGREYISIVVVVIIIIIITVGRVQARLIVGGCL